MQGVSKTFKDQAGATTIKNSFIELGRKIAGKPEQHKKKGFTALKDINFEVKKGEFFGIVGRNGSGKSTLLKILAGVYTSTTGGVAINGSLTPFIELGVGFNPELTGKDNVYLNSALLGFSRKQTDAMYNKIVDFAELHDFMDTKLKNYSSGMQVRLAFSVAIRAESDILLIDEVLAVGDAAFQQKCYEYFEKIKSQKKTIIFVSHDMGTVRQFCDRSLYLETGKILEIGNPEDISRIYDNKNYGNEKKEIKNDAVDTFTFNDKKKRSSNFLPGDKVGINISLKGIDNTVGAVGVAVLRGAEVVFATNTYGSNIVLKNEIKFTILNKLGNGRYRVMVGLFGKNRHDILKMDTMATSFNVYGNKKTADTGEEWEGIVHLDNEWVS